MTQPLPRNRDVLQLWTGEAASDIGSSMTTLVLPIIGYEITGSTVQAGLTGTPALLGSVIARLPLGRPDQWGAQA